jgi:hypothetical protein
MSRFLACLVLNAVLARSRYSSGTLSHRWVRKRVEGIGSLVIVGRSDGPVFEAKWRREGAQVKRRLGRAWLERASDGGWRPRRGRVPEGFLDQRRAMVRMAEVIAEENARRSAVEESERQRREAGATFRELAREWLEQLEGELGAKPSTVRDYGYMLAERGTPHRRGGGVSRGLLMARLGSRHDPCKTSKKRAR